MDSTKGVGYKAVRQQHKSIQVGNIVINNRPVLVLQYIIQAESSGFKKQLPIKLASNSANNEKYIDI